MNVEQEFSDEFQMSQRAVVTLLLLSCSWIALNGAALVPIGLLATVHYVGKNFETTFFASLRRGWRWVAYSAAVSAVSWLVASARVDLTMRNGAFGFGFNLSLF